jgi:hypothetical protein
MRYGAVAGTATGGSTTTLIDTAKLTQADDFWNGQFLYLPTADENRIISDFTASSDTLTVVEPFTATASGAAYEIWSSFTAHEVNDAINQALRDAWPYFFVQTAGHLVLRSGVGVSYPLTSLSPTPKWIAQVLMEQGVNSVIGQVTSAGTNVQVINSSAAFSSDDVGKEVRIYEGTSVGDIRTVASVASASTLSVSVAFSSALDTTSKYRLTDTADATSHFSLITDWELDNINEPTILYLSSSRSGVEGYKLKILYESEFTPYSSETAEVVCPREFLELSALSRLFMSKLTHAPSSELDNWAAMQRATGEAAQAYAQKGAFRHFSGSLHNGFVGASIRPLDWPF